MRKPLQSREVKSAVGLCLCLGLALPWTLSSQSSRARAADIAHEVLAAGLDPTQCYHVRDLQIHQDDATFYLTEGYLILGKPIDGAPITAVFTTDVEGGDGEVVLLAPDRAERRTLASFTGSPNLDEHFSQAILFFTDSETRALAQSIRSNPSAEKVDQLGPLMADKWGVTVTNLVSSFEGRIVLDLLSGAHGFFEAAMRGRKLGDFDIVRDTRASEQIGAGKVTIHNGTPEWDTWTRFVERSRRSSPPPAPEEEILGYTIDASINTQLAMHCVTKMKIRATADSRNVIPLEVDAAMHVVSATVDGAPAEIYQHDSSREGLVQNSGNQLFLVVPPHPLDPGSTHEIAIVHEGKVVQNAGDGVFTVNARGTWYPGRGPQFATYDATYHYPENFDLISAGIVKEEHTEDGVRTSHRVPEGKLRLLGFNLGRYDSRQSASNGITLKLSANRQFEAALRPAPPPVPIPQALPSSHTIRVPEMVQQQSTVDYDPTDRISTISAEMLSAIGYFQSKFGDPPLKHIEVSPVTGRFGQGFAGMIYLPTVVYMDPVNLPVRAGSQVDEGFMARLLSIHETAHQWWGNIVTTESYHHEWLMESLANYSALMFLETKMGPHVTEKALDIYRNELTTKGPDGATAESRGPVVEGRRLESLDLPGAANAVLYGKGTWIMHMLRRRMGDTNFLKMLAELRRRYEWKAVTTEEFHALCAEFMPPGSADRSLNDFFDQWVYDTGMPTIKLTWSVANGKLSGQVTQSDVPDGFSVTVPVEIRGGAAKPIIRQIQTTSGSVKFSVPVASANAKATLDPGWSILRR